MKNDKVIVWIDYNQNKTFEDAEKVYDAGDFQGAGSFSGSITIPNTALSGSTRMRVRVVGSFGTNLTPCGISYDGEVEDYTLNIQEPLACTTVTLPTAGVAPNSNPSISWSSVTNATAYKVYIGTTSGNYALVNSTSTTSTNYQLTGLAANTQYFVKIVPTNAAGDATGCTASSFTTGNNAYCPAGATDGTAESINQLMFSDIDHSSSGTTGYQDFTSVPGNVAKGVSYPLNVLSNASNANDQVIAWIDYNQNKTFEDAEKVYESALQSGPYNGSITIPTTALSGTTRMRVRIFNANTNPNGTPCGNSGIGEVEDYALNIQDQTLGTSDITKNDLTLYPNPFTEIIKISDTKDVVSVSVHDLSGRWVKTLKPAPELDLSTLTSDLYIITLKMKDGSVKSFKVIKK